MANQKFKILGTKYGITITKPWSPEMYDHNRQVATKMKEIIFQSLTKAYNQDNEHDLRIIAVAINSYSYGSGYGLDEIYADACRGLDMVENYWLYDWTWPDLLNRKLVEPIDINFVGYDKK